MTSAHDMALGEESPPEEPSDPPGNWRSLTRIPQTLKYDGSRDNWKPIPGGPFHDGSLGGDNGLRRVLEMVSAAVRD